VQYGPEAEELADVYRPSGVTAVLPAVLVVHGGGWVSGSKAETSSIASKIAAAGFVTVNVNYRLATPTQLGSPHQLHELKQAVEWIRSQSAALNVDPARIGALGTSAGGNLVAMLGTDAVGPLTGGNRIRAAVTWSAPLDLTNQPYLSNDVSIYVGCSTNCSAVLTDASPLYHASSGDTPIAIFNSSDEIVPVEQVIATYQKLQQVSRSWPSNWRNRWHTVAAVPRTLATSDSPTPSGLPLVTRRLPDAV
jgi:acetyl esterase